jgi:hypothetical protein
MLHSNSLCCCGNVHAPPGTKDCGAVGGAFRPEAEGGGARGERQILPFFRHYSLISTSVHAPLRISFFD